MNHALDRLVHGSLLLAALSSTNLHANSADLTDSTNGSAVPSQENKSVEAGSTPENAPEDKPAKDDKQAVAKIQDAIIKQWKRVQTVKMTIDLEVRSRMVGDQDDLSEGGGIIEIDKRGTVRKVRADSRINPVDAGGAAYRHRPSMLQSVIEDGEAIYTIREAGPTKVAYKHDKGTPHFPEFAPDAIFDQLKDTMTFSYFGESDIMDRPVTMLKATAKEGTPAYTFFFDKETGLALKIVMDDPIRSSFFSTFTCIKLELNRPIPADRFNVEIPEGVEINDQTTTKNKPEE
ncbi:MAG: LolA family protein [Phycisphaerae bacterium]